MALLGLEAELSFLTSVLAFRLQFSNLRSIPNGDTV